MSDNHHEDRLQRIREIAYQLWEKEGAPEGRDHEFWLRAEALEDSEGAYTTPAEAFGADEKKVDEESANSFPASDPPSFTPSKAGGTKVKAA